MTTDNTGKDDTSRWEAPGAGGSRLSWRVVDIVVAAVLGVAGGLIFWVWNFIGGFGYEVFDAVTPGLGGLAIGIWLIAGVVGGLIIRKPGAALLVELIASIVSAVLGNQWGATVILSGAAQGLGAELVFLAFAYRSFKLPVGVLAGVGAAVGAFLLELVTSANYARSLEFNIIYLACVVVSGAIIAGALGWAVVRGLAKTGALDRFAAGREAR
ncbi:ECF transporter S component [Corynebacterium otitidis]|uniref:HMP/thiamine permease protein ykoE n=1 Tax=Corynebacterium otitidis ATCC 51513 TaxID=883169 RepID=K0Z442_9CORY|nr:hypothetical protein HMPREF9719_00992 [Corynebacterium otitidis ATCC 51513]